jgi:hypothetical protein
MEPKPWIAGNGGAVPALGAEMLQVRYEELVKQSEEAVRRICAFLDGAFELQTLSWQHNVAHLIPERESPHSQKPDTKARYSRCETMAM